MTSIVRGKINRGDMAFWDGKNATSSRVDATGGSVSGLAINDFVDLLQVFGAGTSRTSGTCGTAIGFVGSVTCCFRFAPGAWVFTSNITFPSTVTCYVAAGATIEPATGVTVTFSGPVIHEATTWTGGVGTVTTSIGGAALIPIQDSGGFYTATDVEGALAELASTATGNGASIIGLEDSGGFYTATDVEAALAELASVATGEGASIIGVEDSAGDFTATNLEAILAEMAPGCVPEAAHDYDTGTFNINWSTGFSSTPTSTANYTRHGKIVVMSWGVVSATSDAATFLSGATDLPATLRPTETSLKCVAQIVDNGVYEMGHLWVYSTGQIAVTRLDGSSFITSGAKALGGNQCFTYHLD